MYHGQILKSIFTTIFTTFINELFVVPLFLDGINLLRKVQLLVQT